MLVAAISDTHVGDALPALPNEVLEVLDRRKPALILHAGDITELVVLRQLSEIAQTLAVRGDNDALDLPNNIEINIDNKKILLSHGDRSNRKEDPSRLANKTFASLKLSFRWWNGYVQDLHSQFSQTKPDCIICGHLHYPINHYYKQTLIVNPGAVYQNGLGMQAEIPSSIAFLETSQQEIQVEFVRLQNHSCGLNKNSTNSVLRNKKQLANSI